MTNDFKNKQSSGARPPRLSPEEYAAKKKAEKEAIYQLLDNTASEVVQSPEKFKAYLDVQSRMDRYTANNALLMYKQFPQASQIKEFDDWAAEGVKVNKGSKTFIILDPYEYTKKDGTIGIDFNLKRVLDVSQTNGKRPAAPTANRDPRKLVAVMLDSAPINIESVSELPYLDMGAFYKNEDQTLYVKRDIGDSVALCQCVAQELGHAELSMNSEVYSRRDMGFQAVCIGYMLCKKYGVDTQNFAIDRIPDELKNKEPKDIKAELGKTQKAFKEITARVSDYREAEHQEQMYDSLVQLVEDSETEPAEPIIYSEDKTILPELTELYRQNNDLVGWICVEDTNINYPVMQTVDNPNYYLKRGFDKEYSSYGCPYVQEDCDVLKPSDNLVIYGHHMNNGSMFADLEKFKDEDFWREHKTIAFNTLTEKNEYEILAVFKTVVYTDSPEAFKYYRFTDAQSPEEFDAYIDKCKELSLYDTGVSAEYGDKLITLSTCEYSRTNGRLVVVAKKVTESSGANAPANDGAAEIPS